ncbi:hypothetical protein ACFWY9_07010 [Amycolatopsis sp. NPDC059027]|uniref:hypothetical protein n=1 Tax=Amycolatopsis sp. NPDC059027 TaxID=3346709 RepID=UPI0036717C20
MSKRTVTCAVAVMAAAAFTVSTPAAAQAADTHAGTKALLDRALRHAPGAAVFAGNGYDGRRARGLRLRARPGEAHAALRWRRVGAPWQRRRLRDLDGGYG